MGTDFHGPKLNEVHTGNLAAAVGPVVPQTGGAPAQAPRGWTAEQIETVRQLYCEEGLSTRIIGRRIGKTRNAVIGLCFRKGWQRQVKIKPGPRPAAPIVITPPPAPEPVVEDAPARPFLARYPEPAVCATPGCRGPRQPGRDICADCHTHQRVPLKPVVNRTPAPFHHHTGRPRKAKAVT